MSFFGKIKKVISSWLFLQDTIVFESKPDFGDSTIHVYNELKKRGYDKKYQFVWITHKKHNRFDDCSKIVKLGTLKSFYYRRTSKYLVFNNQLFNLGIRKKQKMIYISHGEVVKETRNYYYLHGRVTAVINLSPSLSDEYSRQIRCNNELVHGLGFPRNDVISKSTVNLKQIFNFNGKIIFYYPTVKVWKYPLVHHHGSKSVSNILTTLDDYNKLNEHLAINNVLLVMKLHWASGGRDILKHKFSNILLVDESFFMNKKTSSYECLAKCDALLTDYSSTFYDYLIVNKPIGFIWADFEEYSKRPGLADVFINETSKCGSKIYNFDDLFAFINDINVNKDSNKLEREKIRKLVFPHVDLKSTIRVTDFIIKTFGL